MSHKHGTDLGGVNSLERLRLRCWIDPATGCWHWRLGRNRDDGSARVWVRLPDGARRTMLGRKAAYLLSGREVRPGWRVIATRDCHEPTCCNPDHARQASAATIAKVQERMGTACSARKVAAARATAKARRKLNAEQVAMVHRTRGELTAAQVAEQLGCSVRVVREIRQGLRYRDLAPASLMSPAPFGFWAVAAAREMAAQAVKRG